MLLLKIVRKRNAPYWARRLRVDCWLLLMLDNSITYLLVLLTSVEIAALARGQAEQLAESNQLVLPF